MKYEIRKSDESICVTKTVVDYYDTKLVNIALDSDCLTTKYLGWYLKKNKSTGNLYITKEFFKSSPAILDYKKIEEEIEDYSNKIYDELTSFKKLYKTVIKIIKVQIGGESNEI